LSSNTQNQWASYYQSMAPQQVDWASLAQQWIAMKTDMPEVPQPPAAPPQPPPPAYQESIF
jgi:arginine/serine-rich splicing factor 18